MQNLFYRLLLGMNIRWTVTLVVVVVSTQEAKTLKSVASWDRASIEMQFHHDLACLLCFFLWSKYLIFIFVSSSRRFHCVHFTTLSFIMTTLSPCDWYLKCMLRSYPYYLEYLIIDNSRYCNFLLDNRWRANEFFIWLELLCHQKESYTNFIP